MAREAPSPILIAAVIVALAGIAGLVYWFGFRDQPEAPQSLMPTTERPTPEESTQPPVAPPQRPLPALKESDAFVRSVVRELSSHPKLAAWLVPDDLVRRLVVVVDNIARDESPRSHLAHLEPEDGFETTYRDGELVIAPESYKRYDLIAEVVASFDAAALVELLTELRPLLDTAYRELGYPQGGFEQTLKKAIDRVLAVQVPDGTIELERRVKGFRFADPRLEELGPVAKQLLRMGPLNARSVQAKLRAVRTALDDAGNE